MMVCYVWGSWVGVGGGVGEGVGGGGGGGVRLQTFVRAFRFGQKGTKNERSAWTVHKFLSTSGTPPGQALSQAVCHRPSTAVAWIRFRGSCVGFMVDEVARGEDFLRFGVPMPSPYHQYTV